MNIKWAKNTEISFCIKDGKAILSANEDGLVSLAAQFTALACEASGNHIHYDENNAFEEGSCELIVEKKDN